MKEIFDRYLGTEYPNGEAWHQFSRMVYMGLTDNEIKQRHPNLSYESIILMRLALQNLEQNARLNQMSSTSSKKFNVVGKFRVAEDDGSLVVYESGDVVYYENKTYVATKRTSGYSPRHEHGGWRPVTLNNVIDGDTF